MSQKRKFCTFDIKTVSVKIVRDIKKGLVKIVRDIKKTCDTKHVNLDELKTEESESEISDEEMRVFVNLHAGSPQIMSVAQSINDEFHTSIRSAMDGFGEVRFFFIRTFRTFLTFCVFIV